MKSMLTVFVFLLLISSHVRAQVSGPVPAQTVPDFQFSKLDQTPFTNKDLATNKPLFFFFFDVGCDHCQHAMANLNANFKDYKKAAIYLITLDDQQKINAFMHTYGPNVQNQKNVTMLQDTKNEFIVRFKPRKYPSMFLYTADKKLVDYEDNAESMFRFTNHLNPVAK